MGCCPAGLTTASGLSPVLASCGVVNVADYGASPDAAPAENVAAFNAALVAGEGGTVCIPEGVYEVNDSIVVQSNTHVVSHGATLRVPDDTAAGFSTVLTPILGGGGAGSDVASVVRTAQTGGTVRSGIVIEGLHVDCNGDNQTAPPFSFAAFLLFNTESCELIDCSAEEILYDARITEPNTRQFGVLLTDAFDCSVVGGFYTRAGYECIGVRDGSQDCTVEGAYALDGATHAAQTTGDGTAAPIPNGNVWIDCIFSKTGSTGPGVASYITHTAIRTSLIGCRFIDGYASELDSRDTAYVGCIFTMPNNGLNMLLIGGAAGIRVDDSVFFTLTAVSAIIIGLGDNPAHGVTIANNVIRTTFRGLEFSDSLTTACTGAVLANNVFDTLTTSIRGRGVVTGCRVIGNSFRRESGVGPSFGMDIQGSCSGWIIEQNDLSLVPIATNRIVLGGTSPTTHVIRDNPGYVSESQGTATVLTGTTSIAVPHGLTRTPSASGIRIVPTESLAAASEFWISSVGAATFTIEVDADPGADVTFAWGASSVRI